MEAWTSQGSLRAVWRPWPPARLPRGVAANIAGGSAPDLWHAPSALTAEQMRYEANREAPDGS